MKKSKRDKLKAAGWAVLEPQPSRAPPTARPFTGRARKTPAFQPVQSSQDGSGRPVRFHGLAGQLASRPRGQAHRSQSDDSNLSKRIAMHSTQKNAIRFNLESARDRAQQEADLLRLMLRELILLWEQGIIAARAEKAAAVKAKFETARKLTGM